MRMLAALLGIFLLTAPATALARTQPVYNVENATIQTLSGKTLPREQVKLLIAQTATARGWIVHEVAPGHLVAAISPRSHRAVVDIRYTEKNFSITYKESDNLRYDGVEIHRNYNKWIKLLEQDIIRRISVE